MKFFLRLKAWQMFMICTVLPSVLILVLGIRSVGRPHGALIDIRTMAAVLAACFWCELGWIYSIGVYAQRSLPQDLRMNTRLFVWTSRIILFGQVFSLILFWHLCDGGFKNLFRVSMFLFPWNLFIMACIFYQMYFASKTLALAEKQKEVAIADYIANIVLILYFPIGIWFVQPKINKLVS